MEYRDRVYGKVKIEEPVILELIKSKSLQRLKGIDQAGYSPLLSKLLGLQCSKVKHNRFEHSLGVFILLKKFNAPLEEKIAGLLHDLSHSVFSHCIDYALADGSEKEHIYQDKIFENFVRNSEIPAVLKKYKIDVNYILDKKNFPLLENNLPDLCADRLDYSLRTAVVYEEINQKEVNYFLDNLTIENNFWVFKNLKSSQRYANLFLKLNNLYWAGFPSGAIFRTVGDTLRYALSKNYLKLEDLFRTDKEVIQKIKNKLKGGTDEKLKILFGRMEGRVKFVNDPENYNVSVFCKSRIVNPLLKMDCGTKRLSQINKSWVDALKRESKPKKYFIKFSGGVKKLLIATNNLAKLKEYKELLKNFPLKIFSLKDLGIKKKIKENGKTFEENARKKARFYFRLTGLPTLADDGGLEIDYLKGEPGIKSRRWLGRQSSDRELIEFTFKKLKGVPPEKREAKLRAVLALALSEKNILISRGSIKGVILSKPRGKLIPGYPFRSLFYLPEYKKSFNELSFKEEIRIGQRKKAIRGLTPFLSDVKI